MGRKNNRGGRPQARRKADGTRGRATPPPPPLEALVVPRGKCFFRSRKGKLRFSKADAPAALRQAQAKRQRTGSAHMEERVYECPVAQGGCGDWHLTSRTTYEERGTS
jgi:hypothetical protein